MSYLFHIVVAQGLTYLAFSGLFLLMWRAQRSLNYLPYWSIGFFFGAAGWLINLLPVENFLSERMFWLIDISINLVSVSAVTYGFLLRSFSAFNAIWFVVAGFLTLHWVAYFSSIQIDHGLKMAISPLYVAICMQLIVCIMWFKHKRFSTIEWLAASIFQSSVIIHVARAFLYSNQGIDAEDQLLSAYDIVSFIILPFIYTATGAGLMALIFNDKETSSTPLLDLKSGMLNLGGLQKVSLPLMWQCERSGQWVSVIVCKVNHLRTIKRHYGHAVAEQILQSLAQSLSNAVSAQGYIGNTENKEFVILLPMANEVDAATWTSQIHLLASQLQVRFSRELVPVTISLAHVSSCNQYQFDTLRQRAQEKLSNSN